MAARIHLSKAEITNLEEEFVLAALRSGWIAPLGPDVDAFESEIAARVGAGHALALSSGTAALHLALVASGVTNNSTVLVPTMTFAATANAVTYTGAQPIFVEVDSDGNLSPAALESTLATLDREGNLPAAVISVDLFGRTAEYQSLLPIVDQYQIPLIEDAAEALGSSDSAGRAAGSFGLCAAFSFNGNKIMTTSGGGMLVSDDEQLIALARKLSTQAREAAPWYEHREIGYNYRMSNLLAALGRAQLRRLDEMIARRRQIRERYRNAFRDDDRITFLSGPSHVADNEENCWLTCVLVDSSSFRPADAIVAFMSNHNIEARHLWKPMHLQPVFEQSRAFVDGTSEDLFNRGVALPSGAGLTDAEIDRVIETFLTAMKEVA